MGHFVVSCQSTKPVLHENINHLIRPRAKTAILDFLQQERRLIN